MWFFKALLFKALRVSWRLSGERPACAKICCSIQNSKFFIGTFLFRIASADLLQAVISLWRSFDTVGSLILYKVWKLHCSEDCLVNGLDTLVDSSLRASKLEHSVYIEATCKPLSDLLQTLKTLFQGMLWHSVTLKIAEDRAESNVSSVLWSKMLPTGSSRSRSTRSRIGRLNLKRIRGLNFRKLKLVFK